MAMKGRRLLHRRLLHTIISRETIKPSSPTPSHLQTYHLSVLDQIAPRSRMPVILFYPNNANCSSSTTHEKSSQLKKSLSQSLTKYYPFAGRFPTPFAPYIDCNDDGILFLEARNDGQLESFLQKKLQGRTLDQLFPENHIRSSNPVEVQVSHFTCGGFAVAVSMSHKVGDASTLATFLRHWARTTQCGSVDHEYVLPFNPHFISSPPCTDTILPEIPLQESEDVTKMNLVFSNSKLNDLKCKVGGIANPTRVEVLTSLLFKTEVAAATAANSGCFKPSAFLLPVNLRKNMSLPDSTVGNIFSGIFSTFSNMTDITFSNMINELREGKRQLEAIRDVEEASEMTMKILPKLGGEGFDMYLCSSLCRFPFHKVDFGWGMPKRVTIHIYALKNFNLLMDTPGEDGIEASVTLGKEDMAVFQNDKELLEFCF